MKRLPWLLAVSFLASSASVQAEVSTALGIMALSNSTKQGGQGSEGSTFLSQFDLTWHGSWWGLGLFAQRDSQGKSEVDTAYGPRIELNWNPFFLDLAYAAKLNRSFTDRAIAEQEGTGSQVTLGTRFGLGSGGAKAGVGGVSGFFLQFTYTWRTQSIKEQDGQELDEPIVQMDAYPLFGLGYGF